MLEFASDAFDTRLFDTEDKSIKVPGYRVGAAAFACPAAA